MKKQTFNNNLKKIMEHNSYDQDWKTVSVCEKNNHWTPCDLVIREYLNNGCGSSLGFLGIRPDTCLRMYQYICTNKINLIKSDLISKDGFNNFGINLWTDWDFER